MSRIDIGGLLAAISMSGTIWSRKLHGQKGVRIGEILPGWNPETPLPAARHYAYFPQIRQALSPADADYLIKAAPPHIAKRAIRQRRRVAKEFLRGLHEDFSNLARLGRIIAAFSPSVSHEQETVRLMLTLKFQFLYALVWLRLSTGLMPLQQLADLTGFVERLAIRMEEAMAVISAISAGGVSGGLAPNG